MDPLAAKQIEDEGCQKCRARGEDRSAEGLVDGPIDHLGRHIRTLAPQFSQPIEDHNRVID